MKGRYTSKLLAMQSNLGESELLSLLTLHNPSITTCRPCHRDFITKYRSSGSERWEYQTSPLVLSTAGLRDMFGMELTELPTELFTIRLLGKNDHDRFPGMIGASEANLVLRLAYCREFTEESPRALKALVIGTGYGAMELMLAQMNYEVTTVDIGPSDCCESPVHAGNDEQLRPKDDDAYGIFIKAGVELGLINASSVTMLTTTSRKFLEAAANSQKLYDFILVDGCKIPPVVKKDVDQAYMLVANDGIICVNDAGPDSMLHNSGPTMAALDLDYDHGLLTFMVDREGGHHPNPRANMMFAIKSPEYRVQRWSGRHQY